ncbi:MAG: glycosyltransferase family 1 protein [Deltaproteobacteria bacterium]|nr:glycosyltransferase family 1 protein [Deltaproteobacteria bacterium]
MRIVLATFGSRGDVQPMLALSLALKSAGHEVLLAAPPEKAQWAKELGCPFRPLGSNFTAFIDGLKDAHSFASGFRFTSYMRREIATQFDVLPGILEGADLVVGASLVFALASVADFMGVPYRFIVFTPQLLPSSHHPFVAFRRHGLPGWYNRLTWKIARMLDSFNLTLILNRRRKQLCLRPIRDAWLHILGQRVIVASDKAIADVPPDVGIGHAQTGYLHLEQQHEDRPDLEKFLRAGSAPVYAGFGSMPVRDQEKNVSIVVEASRSVGRRVVIGRFWEGPSGLQEGRDVFFIKGYPHLRLFPRMAAVIHHGGAGTTASSAASGVPQIVVPHVLDQYYWGHRVHAARLGPKPIWRAGLNTGKLAAAIEECLANDAIRRSAESASRMIDRRESLEMTVREVIRAVG